MDATHSGREQKPKLLFVIPLGPAFLKTKKRWICRNEQFKIGKRGPADQKKKN